MKRKIWVTAFCGTTDEWFFDLQKKYPLVKFEQQTDPDCDDIVEYWFQDVSLENTDREWLSKLDAPTEKVFERELRKHINFLEKFRADRIYWFSGFALFIALIIFVLGNVRK